MARPPENVVAFYAQTRNMRAVDKGRQRRERGHGCRAARLPPAPFVFSFALAYNLGNFLRTLATLEPIRDWSLYEPEREADQGWREGSRATDAMSASRWLRSPFRDICSPPYFGSSRSCGRRRSRQRRSAFGCHASDQKPRDSRLDDRNFGIPRRATASWAAPKRVC
jgi:hypothetical protein